MLVLSRKSGEKIRIGKDIIISVIGKMYGSLKLGIEAPSEISVYREEVYQTVKNANQKAIRFPISSLPHNLNINENLFLKERKNN